MSTGIAERKLLYKVQVEQDPDAFAGLYDEYVRRIYRFVYFKVGNREEAEDATSEVFLKAWRYLTEGDQKIGSFSGLLYRLARNTVIDLYRSKAGKQEFAAIEEHLEIGDGGKWYADVCAQAETEKILGTLKKLKQEYQEVITLRYIDELEIGEIAEIVGKGKIVVRVTLHRALNKLKELMEIDSGNF